MRLSAYSSFLNAFTVTRAFSLLLHDLKRHFLNSHGHRDRVQPKTDRKIMADERTHILKRAEKMEPTFYRLPALHIFYKEP